jgi:hypothetical protein
MKKSLRKRERATTLEELQAQLDGFVRYYNDERPHRALGRKTPRSAFDAMVKAHPDDAKSSTHFRVRHDKVHATGNVTLRYGSRLHHVGMPRALAGEVVSILVADRDVRVLNMDGELIRHFVLDPSKDYQPISADLGST